MRIRLFYSLYTVCLSCGWLFAILPSPAYNICVRLIIASPSCVWHSSYISHQFCFPATRMYACYIFPFMRASLLRPYACFAQSFPFRAFASLLRLYAFSLIHSRFVHLCLCYARMRVSLNHSHFAHFAALSLSIQYTNLGSHIWPVEAVNISLKCCLLVILRHVCYAKSALLTPESWPKVFPSLFRHGQRLVSTCSFQTVTCIMF